MMQRRWQDIRETESVMIIYKVYKNSTYSRKNVRAESSDSDSYSDSDNDSDSDSDSD